jgi:hypothetical protein
MNASLLLDARFAMLCCMLFTAIITITAREPETIPSVFQLIWRRYQLFREVQRIRSSQGPTGSFWEIDMTKIEP